MGMLQVVQALAAVGIQTVEVTLNFTAPADAAYNIILGEQDVITGLIVSSWRCMQVADCPDNCMLMVRIHAWSFAMIVRSPGVQRLLCY